MVSIDSADCITPLLVVHLSNATREQVPTAQWTRIRVQLLKIENSDEVFVVDLLIKHTIMSSLVTLGAKFETLTR